MAERFRQIKRDQNRLMEKFSRRPWWLGGLALVLPLAVGAYFLAANLYRPQGGSNPPIKDMDLAAAVCRVENCFWINREGLAYRESGRMAGNIVLSVEDKTSRVLAVGEKLAPAETLAELKFLRAGILEDLGIGLKAGETADSRLADFDFVTSEGWRLRLTVNENAYKTIATLKQSLAEITKTAPSSALEYVDLRIPNKVYYKFRGQ